MGMPIPDPLDNIMNVLKGKGTVDHNQAAARSARVKTQRSVVGANPPATKQPPHQGVQVARDVPPDVMTGYQGQPQGIAPDFQEQPNMMSVVVDALNEAIIGLKTEIHRSSDPEQRKVLEQNAQAIRQRIVDMGGEPIYADETIDEGLKKIRGYGAVGADTWWNLNFSKQPAAQTPPATAPKTGAAKPPPTDNRTVSPNTGVLDTLFNRGQGGSTLVSPGVADIFGTKALSVTAPTVRAPRVPVPDIPAPATAEMGPNYFGPSVNQPGKDGAVNELEMLINRVTGREPTPVPEMQVNTEFVNQLVTRMGLQPRSEEELAATAKTIVDRQRLNKEQQVQREIDRFERDHEHEFAKAKKQITEAAQKAQTERREEMAARGMFYSSIMANSLENIDKTQLEMISEIARDAANRVADLHTDLQEIGQWAILEEEFIKRELEAEDRQHREKLMQLHLSVATWADQTAIDTWYKQNALQLQTDQQSLKGIQVRLAHAEQLGQNLAAAFMADHPLAQNTLVAMGITPEAFGQMSLDMQAGLVRSVVGFNEVEQKMRMNELQMRAVVAEIALENARLSVQAQIATGNFQMQAMGMALEMAMHRDTMDLRWAQHGLDIDKFNFATRPRLGGSVDLPEISVDDMDFALTAEAVGSPHGQAIYEHLFSKASPEQQALMDQARTRRLLEQRAATFQPTITPQPSGLEKVFSALTDPKRDATKVASRDITGKGGR